MASFDDFSIQLDEIEGRLENPQEAMETIGVVLIAAAGEAFQNKEFGTFKWPPQYENQPSPWIHKAGVVSDLAKGERIKSTRFSPQSEAILQDSGNLRDSFSVRVLSNMEVQVGSDVPYAKFHQHGSGLVGPAVQPITGSMRASLRREHEGAQGDNKEALGKMFSYFRRDSITTHIQQRPFLGITDQIEEDIRGTIELFIETGQV